MADAFGAYLRRPSEIYAGHLSLTVPWRSAAGWMSVLADQRTTLVLSRVVAEEQRHGLIRELAWGTVTEGDLTKGFADLLKDLTGRPWYSALSLLFLSDTEAVLGRLVLAGADPRRLGLGAWTATVYTLATQGRDEQARFKFDSQLATPPPGHEDEWDDGDDFESMVAAARSMPGMS